MESGGGLREEEFGVTSSLPFRNALEVLVFILLLFAVATWRDEATIEQARASLELVLHEMGLTKNDIENHRTRALFKLQQNPKYAMRALKIAEEAMEADLAA